MKPSKGKRDQGYVVHIEPGRVSAEHRGLVWMPGTQSMQCDARELHYIRRTLWGTWRRWSFAVKKVVALQRAVRMYGRSTTAVLTFDYEGKRWDILESTTYTDAERVLIACRSLGVNAIIPVDEAAAMLRDIDKRGWFA